MAKPCFGPAAWLTARMSARLLICFQIEIEEWVVWLKGSSACHPILFINLEMVSSMNVPHNAGILDTTSPSCG